MESTAKKIVDIFREEGYEIYYVGGYVRDLLLNKTPHDIDMVTNATPDIIEKILSKHNILSFDIGGKKFGTINVSFNNFKYEITTYRKENNYSDNRHPEEVVFIHNLNDDLSRRDFTMNAIAFDPRINTFIDPFMGIEDIKNKMIRMVGDPSKRIKEDPLRILRAIRFSIQYGFTIEEKTAEAIHENIDLLKSISRERKTEELRKILTCGNPIHSCFLEYSDVISTMLPLISDCIDYNQHSNWHPHNAYEHMLCVTDNIKTTSNNLFVLKLAALLHDIGKPKCAVLKADGTMSFKGHPETSALMVKENILSYLSLAKKEYEQLIQFVEMHDVRIPDKKEQVREMASIYGVDFCKQLMILKRADLDDHICPPGKEWMQNGTNRRYNYFLNYLNDIKFQIDKCPLYAKELNITAEDWENIPIPKNERGLALSAVLKEIWADKIPNKKENVLSFLMEYKREDKQEEKNEDYSADL